MHHWDDTMEPLTLLSGLPSPFARMVRIALSMKNIPFILKTEIPWESTTETPQHNPLEKLPILIFPASDGRPPVYDSAHILEYIVTKYKHMGPRLMTGDLDQDLSVKQIVALCVGCMDAIVLTRWEGRREHPSQLWIERQNRKIDGTMKAFGKMIDARMSKKEAKQSSNDSSEMFLVGEELTIADIAVACTVGWINWWGIREGWKELYPKLAAWFETLDATKEFLESRPVNFELSERVV